MDTVTTTSTTTTTTTTVTTTTMKTTVLTVNEASSETVRPVRTQLETIPFSDESDSEIEQMENVLGLRRTDVTSEQQKQRQHTMPTSRDVGIHSPNVQTGYDSDDQDVLDLPKEQREELENEHVLHSGFLVKRAEKRKVSSLMNNIG
jgi:hypothetical protein